MTSKSAEGFAKEGCREISQVQLGAGVGITSQQIRKYERGANRIGASRLQTIARFLEVPVSSFLAAAGSIGALVPMTEKEDLSVFLSTPDRQALNAAFAQIKSVKLRKGILALVKVIACARQPTSD